MIDEKGQINHIAAPSPRRKKDLTTFFEGGIGIKRHMILNSFLTNFIQKGGDEAYTEGR